MWRRSLWRIIFIILSKTVRRDSNTKISPWALKKRVAPHDDCSVTTNVEKGEGDVPIIWGNFGRCAASSELYLVLVEAR